MKSRALMLLMLAGCPGGTSTPDAGGTPDSGVDSGTPDAGTPDAGMMDAGLPPIARTLINRPLMPTSPLNLLRDPLIGGEAGGYGQFRAYFVSGPNVALTRTFQSVSPVGGAVSLEELRDLPADAGASTSVRVLASFLGGPGNYEAGIWLSAGDVSAQPVPIAGALQAIEVKLIDNVDVTQTILMPDAPVTYGAREWVHFKTESPVPMTHGGWLIVALTDFTKTLQLAAPEVTSSSQPMPPHRPLRKRPASDEDRKALIQARALDAEPQDHREREQP